jgi:HPt (histidine-containing phosphotransfer) domain-containing protein
MSAGYRRLREQALALAMQLEELLEQLVNRPDHIAGNPPEQAADLIEGVVAYLEPDEEDTTSNGMDLRVAVDNTRPELRQ